MSEIRMSRASGEDEVTVGNFPITNVYGFRRNVDRFYFRENDFRVREIAQNATDRRSDLRGGKRRGRNLVQEGLKEMMISSVNNSDPHRFPAKLLRCFES